MGTWIHNGAKSRNQLLTAEFAAGELPDHWGNRNVERTNRLLELRRLHHNGVDDTGRDTATRDHPHALHTGALPAQGLVRDPRGAARLR